MGIANTPMTKENVVFFQDSETALRGITALDGQVQGPIIGSCRRRPYDDEERALADVMRQAKSTTAKALLAKLPFGGGCTVLLKDPEIPSLAQRFRALGRAVNDLQGRYILIPDPNDTPHEMDEIGQVTEHVLGGHAPNQIEPSQATARGVVRAIELLARCHLGKDDLYGLRVAIMGLSPSGYQLAEQLRQRGARLVVADRDPRRTERAVRELGIACVSMDEIIHLESDVFAPCAAKDSVTNDVVPHLRCRIIAGTADDILATPLVGRQLHEQGILYAPDVMITAGGMMSLVAPLLAVDASEAWLDQQLQTMSERLESLYNRSRSEARATSDIVQDDILSCLQDHATPPQSEQIQLTAT